MEGKQVPKIGTCPRDACLSLCHTIMQPSPQKYKIKNNFTPLFKRKKRIHHGSQMKGKKSSVIVVSVSEGLKSSNSESLSKINSEQNN